MVELLLLFMVGLIGFCAGCTLGTYVTTRNVEKHLISMKIDPRTGKEL